MCPAVYQMFANTFLRSTRVAHLPRRTPTLHLRGARSVSTLAGNPHIYVHKHPHDHRKSLLSLLPAGSAPPELAIGTTTALPPTPQSFTPNPSFLSLLSSVCAAYAVEDPAVIQQAAVFASPGGSFLQSTSHASQDGSGGASHQGGAGGAGHSGWIHVSDLRNPPDFGRIAWPEDIIGSVEVDGTGQVSAGTWQDSGTYRVVTREGILGLTDFMRGKVVQRLQELEREIERKR